MDVPAHHMWPEALLRLFQAAREDPAGANGICTGAFGAMLQKYCFYESQFVLGPERA